ncbi:hypothetical protein [Agrobacterium vaccinii]|uniref:hypothetical protein n=1 Tax=Agrobacterium vaccinii TaxID=2735528 RepID=UPI001E5B3572|nr:hypothetical protein [Agrobacterium vaccinii]
MTHPLVAFELDEGADERAVKRAYAKRLKATRPDEDPVGFQALHQAYQQALDFIRWRDHRHQPMDTVANETSTLPLENIGSDPETQRMPHPGAGPAADTAPVEELSLLPADDVVLGREFIFSLSDFVDPLLQESQHLDPNRFRQWLRERMADWPLTSKPVLARAIAEHMFEHQVPLKPDRFDILVDELGLNDVRSGLVDPMQLAYYREGLVFDSQSVPPVRRTGWWRSSLIELVCTAVFCLGGLALIAYSVAMTPAPKPTPWYVSSLPSDGPISTRLLPGADPEARRLIEQASSASDVQVVTILDQVIERLSESPELANERLLALALYNKGHKLQHTDRSASYAAYGQLQRRFGTKKDVDIGVMVAASYVNMGHEDFETNRLETALEPLNAVIELYRSINEGPIGRQVLAAMVLQAETLILQRKPEDARRKLDEIDARVGLSSDPAYPGFKSTTNTLRAKLPPPQT